MAKTKHTSPTALSYAQAFLELAVEKNQSELAGIELRELADVIQANPTFKAYLADPAVSEDQRLAKLKTILSGQVSPLLLNFIGVLNEKRRLVLLSEIADGYKTLLDVKLGNVEADVTVAQQLPPDQLEQVRRKISTALGKNALVRQSVDDSIIGGLVLRVGDQLIDASVKTQLQAMKAQLLSSRK